MEYSGQIVSLSTMSYHLPDIDKELHFLQVCTYTHTGPTFNTFQSMNDVGTLKLFVIHRKRQQHPQDCISRFDRFTDIAIEIELCWSFQSCSVRGLDVGTNTCNDSIFVSTNICNDCQRAKNDSFQRIQSIYHNCAKDGSQQI